MKRRIILNGQGYGFADVRLNVTVDGESVFQGTIPTLDEPVPPLPFNSMNDGELGQEIAHWEVDMDFVGSQNLEINVESGTFLMTGISATHSFMPNPDAPPQKTSSGDQPWYCPADILTQVKIDGQPANLVFNEEFSGQWIWRIRSGSNLQATVNVPQSYECNEWSPERTYKKVDQVKHSGRIYIASGFSDTVPAGTPVTDLKYWKSLPYENWNIEQSYVRYSRVQYQGCQYTANTDIPSNTPINDPRWTAYPE